MWDNSGHLPAAKSSAILLYNKNSRQLCTRVLKVNIPRPWWLIAPYIYQKGKLLIRPIQSFQSPIDTFRFPLPFSLPENGDCCAFLASRFLSCPDSALDQSADQKEVRGSPLSSQEHTSRPLLVQEHNGREAARCRANGWNLASRSPSLDVMGGARRTNHTLTIP